MPLPRSMLSPLEPRDVNLRVVAGVWPKDLRGHYFLSSPDPRSKGPHGFFGDGVLYRISLEPGLFGAGEDELALRHGVMRTASQRIKQRHPDAFRPTAVGNLSPFGPNNAVNTAQVPWHDRLLVTWDGGRPVEVDPITLEVLGEIGHRSEWDDLSPLTVFPLIASPAHPVIDPELGCLWTISYSPSSDRTSIIRCDARSAHVERWPIEGAILPQLSHTISITRDWIILIDNAYRMDPREAFGMPKRLTTLSREPVLLIQKAKLLSSRPGTPVSCHRYEIGPECMHFYADYDDANGIRLFVEHSTDSDIAMAVQPGDVNLWGEPIDPQLAGMYGLALSPPAVSLYEIDPIRGTCNLAARTENPERYWNVQTSAMDWSARGLSRPTLHHVMYNGFKPEGITQRQFELYEHRIDRVRLPDEQPACLVSFDWNRSLAPRADHQFALDEWATSPTFVPRAPGKHGDPYEGADPGGHDGYVIVSVLCDRGFRLDVFDAADVGKGPIAQAQAHGHRLPFVIHSSWMPRLVSAPDIDRPSFRDEITRASMLGLSRQWRRSVHEVAEELDHEQRERARSRTAQPVDSEEQEQSRHA